MFILTNLFKTQLSSVFTPRLANPEITGWMTFDTSNKRLCDTLETKSMTHILSFTLSLTDLH